MLSLQDLDFENNGKSLAENLRAREQDSTIREIRETRTKLGKFTLRDSMEAVYGTAYTVQVLGEEGGNDILIEELSAMDDVREASGKKRRDIGDNRMPQRKLNEMSPSEQAALKQALVDQERDTDDAVVDSHSKFLKEDAKAFNAQKVVEDLSKMLPEQRDEIIRLLQSQARGSRS